jgi:hypothetical protein
MFPGKEHVNGHRTDGSYWMSPAFVMVFNDPLSLVVTLIRIVIHRFGLLRLRALFREGPEPQVLLWPQQF